MQKTRHSFTLIELLVVIGIIMVLAGITMAGLGFAGRRADETKTQAIMEEFAMALDAFRQDRGYYPIQTSTTDTDREIKLKVGAGNTWHEFIQGHSKTGRPYMEGFGTDGDELLDAYGNLLKYQCPGVNNTSKYDLWSMGPDGADGFKKVADGPQTPGAANSDDICNWKQKR